MRTLSMFVLFALAAPAAAPAAADPLAAVWAKIQPSRGVYTLRQRSEPGTGDAIAMTGRMVMEARLTCSEIQTLLTMDIRATSGAQTMTASVEQKATETLDGKVYRFSMRTLENGRETERREGQAVLQSREGPGEATIKGASGEDLKLDAGTILPGTHLLRMISAASQGKQSLEHRVFYGLDQMKVVLSKVSIRGAGRSGKEKGLGEFADKPGWTFREEHQEVGGQSGASQSMEMFMTEDAVTTRVIMTVQGLDLVASPLSVEKLPKPECKN